MDEWIKPVVTAVITGLVLAFVGYLSIAKVNQKNIENTQLRLKAIEQRIETLGSVSLTLIEVKSKLENVSDSVDYLDDKVSAIKIFVIREHPENVDAWRLSAIKKLKGLSMEDLELLVDGLKSRSRIFESVEDLFTKDSNKSEKMRKANEFEDLAAVKKYNPKMDAGDRSSNEELQQEKKQESQEEVSLEEDLFGGEYGAEFSALVEEKKFSQRDLADYAALIGRKLPVKGAVER